MADDLIERCLVLLRRARGEQGDALAGSLDELEAQLGILDARAAEAALRAAPVEPYDPTEPAIALDLAGYLTGWNAAEEVLFGYSREEAIGQHVLFLYADDDDDAAIAELFLDAGSGMIEVKRRKKNGEVILVRLSLSLVHDAAGEPAGMLVHVTPIIQELSDNDKVHLHARIIEDSDQGVLITDSSERIVSINSAFTRITGYTPVEAIGKTPNLLRSGVHDAEFRAKVRAAMRGHGPWRGEIVGKRKNGDLFPQSVTISAVRDSEGSITHTFSLFSDITLHKDAEARMQRMANYDTLTGLPNRSLLTHLMGQALMAARRSGQYGALLVIDIHRIAAISDTLGHDVAGELLCEAGRRLRSVVRDTDILARIDGSKFAVALPHIDRRDQGAVVARKLFDALAAPLVIGGQNLQATASIGISVYPEDGADVPALIRCADVAMARAQESGAGSFLFYREQMDERAKEHLRLETELRIAATSGQLELHYQPKVSLRSGRIVGAEALIRWRHPERGMISPGVFIPLAEETGLIHEIGSWVLEEAGRQIGSWRSAGLAMPPVAVNLSARQFDRRLPSRILGVLDRHGVVPEQIMLEITESLLVAGADNVVAIMNELVAMGLALDDFGTGYSSLAYLKKFPISTLKIDRAFVVGLPHEENDCAIARAIVTMAQQLRQEIVAEGVETEEQMAFLRDLGCDQLQGYLFSPAVTAAEFERMQREGVRLSVAR
ncbi:putative bifunctional diguanylate cyclase/phosphodiesterase [Massilia cavernae]|uniref:EAL domain-containing protein n=1 Tax=Massilia cavernae TaxID=2320864 RepID=A0A418Y844_9BURK|nr:EAL domain-containing protein [Massilia cavernae]RJG27226.1 EAL domain-containing protein [Massilia cavernae]